jgi:SAM-dependent methyltransferase
MKRSACGSCGSRYLTTVLDLGTSPLADEFAKTMTEAQALPRWHLGLQYCGACTLVQLDEIVPDEFLWGGDYGFYASSSPGVVAHSRAYAEFVERWYGNLLCDGLTVEIACNDGVLMKQLRDRDAGRLIGIDPAAGPVADALAEGLDVIQAQFSEERAYATLATYGSASLVVANNVIAHVYDLPDFLRGIAALLSPYGVALVEFQYVVDLLAGNQFDHVYHEHRQFFSLTSLSRAVEAAGLMVTDVWQNRAQGGSLRVELSHRVEPSSAVRKLLQAEESLCVETFGGMQVTAKRVRSQLRSILIDAKSAGLLVAGYGASAKSTTLLNFCDIGPDLVPYVLDLTPTKIGRFTPGTGIPIVDKPDGRAPNIHLLTVWNYASAIMRREREFADRGGQWLIPSPIPTLL